MPSTAGDHQFTLIDEDGSVLAMVSDSAMKLTERTVTFLCSSGDEFGGTWRGISLATLLDESSHDTVTHLVFVSTDGFQVCLPVTEATDAIVATERVDDTDDGLPRLIAPSISGSRTIKDIHLVQVLRLAPDEDPADYETLPPSVV